MMSPLLCLDCQIQAAVGDLAIPSEHFDTMRPTWKQRVRQLKQQVYALYIAYRDPRTPWHARLFAACVVAYFFSPIDLIPDPIPILGQLDDLILVPLGILIAIKLIPQQVWIDAQARAAEVHDRPTNRIVVVVIVLIWLALAALVIAVVAHALQLNQ